jgi:hypothetical protein
MHSMKSKTSRLSGPFYSSGQNNFLARHIHSSTAAPTRAATSRLGPLMTPEDDDLTYFQVTCLVCAHIWSTQRPARCWALMTNRSGQTAATPTGGSSLGASSHLRSVSLKTNWLRLGLNGMKRDVLDGRTSSTSRACASDRTIKISASIATTIFSIKPNSDIGTVDLSLRKTVIGSTTFARC